MFGRRGADLTDWSRGVDATRFDAVCRRPFQADRAALVLGDFFMMHSAHVLPGFSLVGWMKAALALAAAGGDAGQLYQVVRKVPDTQLLQGVFAQGTERNGNILCAGGLLGGRHNDFF